VYVAVTAAALNALIVASAAFQPADQVATATNGSVDSQPTGVMRTSQFGERRWPARGRGSAAGDSLGQT